MRKNIRKNMAKFLAVAALAAGLSGCGADEKKPIEDTTGNKITGEAEGKEDEQKKPESGSEAEQEKNPSENTQKEPENPDQSSETKTNSEDRRRMYQFTLQQLSFEHLWPDGTKAIPDDMPVVMEQNEFSLIDVDGDGREELIIELFTAPTAGMNTVVYDYPEKYGELEIQLSEYPSVTFYENGFVKADCSHNMGLSDETFWPYKLLQYNAETDKYDLFAEVDAWSRQKADVNEKGDPYPDDVDTMNAGQVYIVAQGNVVRVLNKDDYEEFWNGAIGDGKEKVVPYVPMSEGNLRAIWKESPEQTE